MKTDRSMNRNVPSTRSNRPVAQASAATPRHAQREDWADGTPPPGHVSEEACTAYRAVPGSDHADHAATTFRAVPGSDHAATTYRAVPGSDHAATTCRAVPAPPAPMLDDAKTRFLPVAQAKSAARREPSGLNKVGPRPAARESEKTIVRADPSEPKTTVAPRRESQAGRLPAATPQAAQAPRGESQASRLPATTPQAAQAPRRESQASRLPAAPQAALRRESQASRLPATTPQAAQAPRRESQASRLPAPAAQAPRREWQAPQAASVGNPMASAPQGMAPALQAGPVATPMVSSPAPAVIDGIPVVRDTPELFALMRRVALQSDVANAAGVLHAGLGELLFARVALAVISPTGAISSPVPGDLSDAARVVRLDAILPCAQQRKIFGTDRYLLVPVAASVPAVLVVWRAPGLPPLDAAVATLAVAAASRLVVIDHFLATQASDKKQADADAHSVFRPEALSASRATDRVGNVVNLSPRWVRLGLPVMLGIGALLITAAAIIQVPSYSRGTVVVRRDGHNVIANAQGRISKVLVTPGQRVTAGAPLIVLDTTHEQQAFAQVDTVYRDQLGAFLVDPSDESARQSLAGIMASHTAAADTLATKTITAPIDGVVGAVLANDMVTAGEHVLTIIPEGSESSIVAFMPGYDLARIKVGMTLQVEMTGYTHKRVELEITEVGDEVINQLQARKQLGQKLADVIRLPTSTVIVKAKLTTSSFEADGHRYELRDGMDGIGEIAVDTRSLISMVLNTGD